MAERAGQELVQACLGSPVDEAVFLEENLSLGQLTLEHASRCLDLP